MDANGVKLKRLDGVVARASLENFLRSEWELGHALGIGII